MQLSTTVEKKKKKKFRALRKDSLNSEKIRDYEILFNGLCRELNRRYGKDYVFGIERFETTEGISFNMKVKKVGENYFMYLRRMYGEDFLKTSTWSVLTAYKRLFRSIFSGMPFEIYQSITNLVNEKNGLDWEMTRLEPVERTSHTKVVTIIFPKYSSVAECFLGMSLLGWNLFGDGKEEEEEEKNKEENKES